ncbi:hypothetical protein DM860_014472 [Cuscuta australis]|uniref:Amino acid transporter transmembrane domain-containing protein n=1 Tax=Cuscuta australis TaxID=267555 RepID=A0A328DZ76_9ASTE|nr:hypothetical protein DM860_014472 [Cuscuta australis]
MKNKTMEEGAAEGAVVVRIGRMGSGRVVPEIEYDTAAQLQPGVRGIFGVRGDSALGIEDETPVELQAVGGIILRGNSALERSESYRELAPIDSLLPITQSRNGNFFTVTFHLLSSGIGLQALLLPAAFTSLGWVWGIVCLSLLFAWQLYTTWLLVDLHESTTTGTRFSRYVHLAIVAFGEKTGKLAAIFPTMYLSGGACALLIINGGGALESFYKTVCGSDPRCHDKGLTGAEWFLVFACVATLVSLFFPSLNSLGSVSLLGSVTGVAYCTLLWTLSLSKGRPEGVIHDSPEVSTSKVARFRDIANALAIISLAFRGHNLVLEIQGTLPTNNVPLRRRMLRGVVASYLVIALCHFPLAIAGYWAYGNLMPWTYNKGGILVAFAQFHRDDVPKFGMGAIYLIIIIASLCNFQIYAMPTLDNWERIYLSKKKANCPRWLRTAIKVLFGGLTYFVSMAFPFLGSLAGFVGSIALPLTLAYPCFMWIAMKTPRQFSLSWCFNMALGCLGLVVCMVLATTTLWDLIANGLHANFFKP